MFLSGAIVVALVAVGFAQLADLAQEVFNHALKHWMWLPLIVTPISFAVLAYITRRWYPAAQGSGIPQVIAARASKDQAHRFSLLDWRMAIAKIVMTSVAILTGASVGREGPSVQIGASIMFAIAGFARLGRADGLVLAGSAAGVAAAFNAPLAGIVFAIEEVAKSFTGRVNELVLGSVIVAGGVSWLLLGNYSYFGGGSARVISGFDWLAVLVCAIIGGALGGLFSRTMIAIVFHPPEWVAKLKRHPIYFAAICGLVVAILSIATNGYASGSGYTETRSGLYFGITIPWYYGLAKMVATLLSAVSGIPGGLFSPSLAAGAGIGSMVAEVLTFVEPRNVLLLMMAGYFAGVVQSPLTAAVIVIEMTSDRAMVIPLLATALLASSVSRVISRRPLYHALSLTFAQKPATRKP
ncbi:MAG: chloride channel protein [Hyphomicrobiaceae bacterium]